MNASIIPRSAIASATPATRTICRVEKNALKLAFLLLATILTPSRTVHSQTVQFQLNPTLSTLSLTPATFNGVFVSSGTKLTDTIGIIQQEAQSLTTKLSGVLVGTLNGGILTLSSQSLVVSLENPVGPFVPDTAGFVDVFGGLAVSNGGGELFEEAELAVRDVTARLLNGAITIGSPASSVTIESAGILDVLDSSGFGYSEVLTDLLDPTVNTSSQPVTGDYSGTIQIPFSLDYVFDFFFEGDGLISMTGTIVATRVNTSIPGDFDGNNVVNAADLTRWRGDFGIDAMSNADGDGDSDGADFLIWQRNLGRTSATPAAAAIPEPSAVWLAFAAAVGVAQGRPLRRRKFGRADAS